jgi:glycerol-3-phosphate dehydrogenase (NAD(P)+)
MVGFRMFFAVGNRAAAWPGPVSANLTRHHRPGTGGDFVPVARLPNPIARPERGVFAPVMNFSVLGAGAWGTAMAVHLSRLGHTVTLVPRRFEMALELGGVRENRDYLPGHKLPGSLQIGFELAPVLMEAEVIILACPVMGVREWAQRIRGSLAGARALRLVLSLAKGIEAGSHLTPCQIVREILPDAAIGVGTLTGPSHAAEVAEGRPTALVMATEKLDEFSDVVQVALSSPTLRIYTTDDLVGAELGGALKNVYAIAAGLCDGLGLGDNAKAALVTRALAEIMRIGEKLGARAATFAGLSGFGDLIATCYGEWSRNHEFGHGLGRGRSVDELMRGRRTVVEGYRTTESLSRLQTGGWCCGADDARAQARASDARLNPSDWEMCGFVRWRVLRCDSHVGRNHSAPSLLRASR